MLANTSEKMGKNELEQFLSYLAGKKNVAAATPKQALNTLFSTLTINFTNQYIVMEPGNLCNMLLHKFKENIP